MIVETFPAGPLGCNCAIVGDETTKDAVVIDPGGDLEQIEATLRKHGLHAKAIVHTHTHIDHVGATAELQASSSAPARIHEADYFLYSILPIQAQLLGMGRAPRTCELDAWLVDGEVIDVGGLAVHVIHTPGHTPGSCCFEVRSKTSSTSERVGRTDLWGGDQSQLLTSIKKKLFALPDPTRVVCGHGGDTTIGGEKRFNPFVGVR